MATVNFSMFDAVDLKQVLRKEFDIYLHIHDRCGSSFFRLDEANSEVQTFIKDYFVQRDIEADFDDDGLIFVLKPMGQ